MSEGYSSLENRWPIDRGDCTTPTVKDPLAPGRGRRTRSKRWSIDRLIPYAKNARIHSDAQIAAIAASIKEWGWTTPALVGEDGGLTAKAKRAA